MILHVKRLLSSKKIQECKATLKQLNKYNTIHIDTTLNQIDELGTIREKIDTKTLLSKESMHYYTSLINSLILSVKNANSVHVNIYEEQLNAPLLILLSLKENIGLLRAEGTSITENGYQDVKVFNELIVLNRAYTKSFELLAPPNFMQKISDIESSKNSISIQNMQNDISKKLHTVNPNTWFKQMSLKIDLYEEVIYHIVTTINSTATSSMHKAMSLITILWVTLIIIFSLTLYISFVLKESILKPIENFTKSMQGLVHGDKTFYFNTYRSDDIIGKMIAAFDAFRRSLIKADFSNILLEIQEQKTENFELLAHVDPLTNALNRRKYRTIFQQEFDKAKENNMSLCILALDLDKFKDINDTYGHDVGDSVLKKFSSVVQHTIRPTDYLARVGGEEFSLILPQTDTKIAIEVAQRILENIEAIDLSYIDKGIHLTVSIGVSTYTPSSTMDSMIKDSDTKLYEAKESGRNRVCY